MNLLHTHRDNLLMCDKSELYDGTSLWFGTDTLYQFQDNLRQGHIPEDYQQPECITYKFNSQGFRTSELSSYTHNEFLLALGCSYTQGVGLRQSETWCEILANNLDIQCMNLALGGTGVDYVYYQTLAYVRTNRPTPKIAVYQITHQEREGWMYTNHTDYNMLVKVNPKEDFDPPETVGKQSSLKHYQSDKTLTWDHFSYRTANYLDAISHIWNSQGVPVIFFTFDTDADDNSYSSNKLFKFPRDHMFATDWHQDLARDCHHFGPKVHLNVSKNLQRLCETLINSHKLKFDTNQVIEVDLSPEEIVKRKILGKRNSEPFIYR